MGKLQDALTSLFHNAGYRVGGGDLLRPTASCRGAVPPAIGAEIERVYRVLSGALDEYPIGPGRWDMELEEIGVELDEEQHFNRYRLATLDSNLYLRVPGFPVDAYRTYCVVHEKDCIRKASRGGYWTSASSAEKFGDQGAECDSGRPGSPRWKQRAFYDYLKDLAPMLTGTPVARIAIWDEISINGNRVSIHQALRRSEAAAVPGLYALILERSGHIS